MHEMAIGVALAALALILTVHFLTRQKSLIRNIIGPPSPSWIFGHVLQLFLSPQYGDYEFRWLKLYGGVYRLKGCFGQDRLMISDPLALQYILHSPKFQHGPLLEKMVDLLFGKESVVGVNGDIHKRLRTGLNIGFTASAVHNYQPMLEKVAQTITEQLEKSSTVSIDICPLLDNAALDAIGEATLGYSRQDLGEEFVDTHMAIIALASSRTEGQIFGDAVIAQWCPKWVFSAASHLPTATFNTLRKEKRLAHQIGSRSVEEKLHASEQGLETNNDIYSLLLNPDTLDRAREPLTREEVVAQTAIILIAGQETTANTLSFGLLELARHREFQQELRAEIHSFRRGTQGNVAYDDMSRLNAFIKEVLRMYPTEATTERIAVQDTIIPLSNGITTSTGEHISRIPVQKGQIQTVNVMIRLESRWGADAHQFKPSRWIDGSPSKGEALGPYANLRLVNSLSFLGGPHTCLGWRFAVLEMQVIICELVGKFSFALADEEPIRTCYANTLYPGFVSGKKGAPLRVTRI
ncbi:cytochrome P450 [Mycena crocata]|nr:cytochrome P450 [Mycena crocata]